KFQFLESLVDMGSEGLQVAQGDRISRVSLESSLKLDERLRKLASRRVKAAKVQVGEMPRLVPRRFLGLLEPRRRLDQISSFHQIAPDVVVRVSEGRVRRDRFAAFFNSLLQPAFEGICPAAKRIRLRRGLNLERAREELNGLIELSRKKPRRTLLPEAHRLLQRVGHPPHLTAVECEAP